MVGDARIGRTALLRRVLQGALLVVTAFGFAGCGPTIEAPNLIVISIDTLRADSLGCYGYDRETSPRIDAYAERGVVFEDASATSPWTKPSHASIFTGLYPSRHGAYAMQQGLSEEVVHLATWLADLGFSTAAIVNTPWLTVHGMRRGFQDLSFVEYVASRPDPPPVTDAAIDWLEQRSRRRPFFALVHYMDVHGSYRSLPETEALFVEPYDGPADGTESQLQQFEMGLVDFDQNDGRHLRRLYDAGVRQVDREVGRLLDYLESAGLLQDSIVVITSDHGEEFLEHGGVHHGHTHYQEVIGVPLIFLGKGIPSGVRVADPVSLIDIMPTALELLEIPAPERLDGVAIQGSWSGSPLPPRELFFEADCTRPTLRDPVLHPGWNRGVRNHRFKLLYDIDDQVYELFDLSSDPGELIDVQQGYPEVMRDLTGRMEEFLSQELPNTPVPPMEQETIEQLRALGYVGGG